MSAHYSRAEVDGSGQGSRTNAQESEPPRQVGRKINDAVRLPRLGVGKKVVKPRTPVQDTPTLKTQSA